jgi:F0F1-type ATP synthase assembly protein I
MDFMVQRVGWQRTVSGPTTLTVTLPTLVNALTLALATAAAANSALEGGLSYRVPTFTLCLSLSIDEG